MYGMVLKEFLKGLTRYSV